MNKWLAGGLGMLLLMPQLASAAWWNPLSWFSQEGSDKEKQELLNRVEELEKKLQPKETTSLPSPVEVNKEDVQKEKPKVIEKTVTQTIKVDNPELQKKINDLVAQDNDLTLKYNSLLTKYNSATEQLSQCRVQLSSASGDTTVTVPAADLEKKKKLEDIDKKLLPLLDTYLAQKDGYGTLASNPNYQPLDIARVNQLLQSYRVVDTKMTHEDLIDGNDYNTVGALRRYLKDTYIPYR